MNRDLIIKRQFQHGLVGKLITELALEWRQEMDAVGIMIQNFEDAFKANELTLEYIQEKTNASLKVLNKISKCIEDFKFLRYQNRQTNKFDVKEILQRCSDLMKMLLKDKNIKLTTICEVNGFVEGQANEFALILLSLILNAKESIEEMKHSNPEIKVICKNKGEKVLATVQDNGKGIPYAIQDELFDPFFTTKDELEHSGMGLYVSKLIIEEDFKGTLRFKNIKEGAEFSFEV
jgi:C4-dicarboxylate-specific signal transduction histidine kinase